MGRNGGGGQVLRGLEPSMWRWVAYEVPLFRVWGSGKFESLGFREAFLVLRVISEPGFRACEA